ncbi:MAG: ATP-binding cassette domain-containing protein [Ruminococcaceae bacterium]|nr:ATP-binding cassette domain-containing protein [Oscillospiraceae bacterium]
MIAFDKLPNYIGDIFEEKGIDADKVYLITYCDMNREHVYADSYIFATDKRLYVICGTDALSRKDGVGKGLDRYFSEQYFLEYDLEDIEEIRVEELLATARLTAKTKDGESIFLAAMTNFCRANANLFVKYLMRIKKGEITSPDFTLDTEDDPKENSCPKCGMRYPDRNRKVCPRCMEKGKLYKRFGVFFLKYRIEIFLMILSLVFITAAGILTPYLSKGFFFDKILDENGSLYGQVLLAVGIIAATKLLSHLADMVNGWVTTKMSAKIVYDLKNTIFGSIERLSLSFFNGRQTGGLMTQVNDDSNTIYGFFCDGMPFFLINIVQVIVLAVIMFVMNPLLAALTLITVPVFFFVIRYTYNAQRKLHAKNWSGVRRLHARLSDVLGGIRVVKAFSKEDDESERFHTANARAAKGNKRVQLFNNYVYPYIGYILYIGNIISLGVGGYMVIKGKFSYGELLTFTAYVNMIYSPMYFFSHMVDWYASTTNALQRLFEIMDSEPDITEKPDAITPENIEGRVEFKNVDFGYTKSKKVIDNVSFDIEAGHILGIVGHTGAGKSTIANLIMRLYDADEGEILIDSINVKDLSFKALYENIAIVSQETYLFIGSILDNIRYAKPDASYEEIIWAAKCAGAHDFIVKLPDGYNTMIGFGSKDLSGGERQRVSIARAILRDPKILILDEATAAMDTKTEKLIQTALHELTKGKTTIMIAHRLSTLRDAHKLIVIENGKVAEQGTHKELLDKEGGVYNKLYTLQLEALKNAGITE